MYAIAGMECHTQVGCSGVRVEMLRCDWKCLRVATSRDMRVVLWVSCACNSMAVLAGDAEVQCSLLFDHAV